MFFKTRQSSKQTNPFLPSSQILLLFSLENTEKIPESSSELVKMIVNIALVKA